MARGGMTEYHVCGVLLTARPEQAAAVEQALLGLAGVELHASAGGRLVVTLEGPSYGPVSYTHLTLPTNREV